MYKVIVGFADLQDPCEGHEGYPYQPGDVFPRKGMEVSDERIAELASASNKRGVVLIEKVAEKKKSPAKKPAKKKTE